MQKAAGYDKMKRKNMRFNSGRIFIVQQNGQKKKTRHPLLNVAYFRVLCSHGWNRGGVVQGERCLAEGGKKEKVFAW